MSYDPVEVLAGFAKAHGITYPLLADVGSVVIERLGILNTTIEAERAAYGRAVEERHRRLPYPGTFALDADGIVVDRRFEDSHRIRPTTRSLLEPLDVALPPEVVATASGEGFAIRVSCDNRVVSANQLQHVAIEVALDDGAHIYVEPVPDGYRALHVAMHGPDTLRPRLPELPAGRPFAIEGLPDTFSVVSGTVKLDAAFYVVSGRDTAGDEGETVVVSVGLSFQVCTDQTCYLPETVTLELPFELVPNPAYESIDRASLRPLVIRRLDEQPRAFDDLHARVAAAVHGGAVSAEDVRAMLRDLADEGLVAVDGAVWSIRRPD